QLDPLKILMISAACSNIPAFTGQLPQYGKTNSFCGTCNNGIHRVKLTKITARHSPCVARPWGESLWPDSCALRQFTKFEDALIRGVNDVIVSQPGWYMTTGMVNQNKFKCTLAIRSVIQRPVTLVLANLNGILTLGYIIWYGYKGNSGLTYRLENG